MAAKMATTVVTSEASSRATTPLNIPHLVKKIKSFPLKVKSFQNTATYQKFRGGAPSNPPPPPPLCTTVGVWICVYVRGLMLKSFLLTWVVSRNDGLDKCEEWSRIPYLVMLSYVKRSCHFRFWMSFMCRFQILHRTVMPQFFGSLTKSCWQCFCIRSCRVMKKYSISLQRFSHFTKILTHFVLKM